MSSSLPYLTGHELLQIIKANKSYLIIDTRDSDFNENGHIKGALNLPLKSASRLDSHYKVLSKFKVLVFHCALSQVRGPKAAKIYLQYLIDNNLETQQVFVLQDGYDGFYSRFAASNKELFEF